MTHKKVKVQKKLFFNNETTILNKKLKCVFWKEKKVWKVKLLFI